MIEGIVQELANVGFTLLVFIVAMIVVNKFKGEWND